MSIQTFVPDEPVTTGKTPTSHTGLSAADTFRFANNGKVFLRVKAEATEAKVKVAPTEKVDGLAPAAREVAVKEGSKLIGPFDPSKYNDEEGFCSFTLSAATGVTVEVVELDV